MESSWLTKKQYNKQKQEVIKKEYLCENLQQLTLENVYLEEFK